MYDLFKDYGGKVDIKDQVAFEDMMEEQGTLRNRLADMETWVQDQHTKMVGGSKRMCRATSGMCCKFHPFIAHISVWLTMRTLNSMHLVFKLRLAPDLT